MAPLLKEQIDRPLVELLGGRFAKALPGFDTGTFASVADDLAAHELKDRINLIADGLATSLPDNYPEALAVVCQVAEGPLEGWAGWPLCSFVERHGIDFPEESLVAMPTLTKRFSCEFAIRPFLQQHLDATVEHLHRWVDDDDEAVRRLPSEGTRPALPWGTKVAALTDDPAIGIALLTKLRNDPSETVRRSVANHLNDIAKFDADLVVETLRTWDAAATPDAPLTPSMVRHALRTLIKDGHNGALQLLGFTTEPEVSVSRFSCLPASVRLGEHIELEAELASASDTDQHLVIDFVIHHVQASGAASPKVFKWTNQRLSASETVTVTKRRKIQQASTRTYHPGNHQVDLQVAGTVVATTNFDVVID